MGIMTIKFCDFCGNDQNHLEIKTLVEAPNQKNHICNECAEQAVLQHKNHVDTPTNTDGE